MKKLKIDEGFRDLIPPLSDDEFAHLKQNILLDGCREPIVIWNDTIVDGHNRYKICTENNVPFHTVSKKFAGRTEVMMWMLRNQLGRRNLNDFQRNEIALKYEQVIAEQMKQRQVERGKQQADFLNHSKSRPNEPLLEKTSKRKEMAKIAGTSEGSVQRTKLILEQGTDEQINRARQGGAGNTIATIANEIKNAKKPKTETRQPQKITAKNIIGDLYDDSKEVVFDMDGFIEEFEVNFEDAFDLLQSIIRRYKEALANEQSQKKLHEMINKACKKIDSLKGDFLNESK